MIITEKILENPSEQPSAYRVFFQETPLVKYDEHNIAFTATSLLWWEAQQLKLNVEERQEINAFSLELKTLGSFAADFSPDSYDDSSELPYLRPVILTPQKLSLLGTRLHLFSQRTETDLMILTNSDFETRSKAAVRDHQGMAAAKMVFAIQEHVTIDEKPLFKVPTFKFGFNQPTS